MKLVSINARNAKVIHHQQAGASMVEYALVVLLVAMMGFASVNSVGTSVAGIFKDTNCSLGESVGNPGSCGSHNFQPPPP